MLSVQQAVSRPKGGSVRRWLSSHVVTSGLISMMRIGGIGLQAITLILLARLLPPATLGIYATVYACTALARLLGPVGFDQLAMRGLIAAHPVPGGVQSDGAATLFESSLTVLSLNGGVAIVATIAWLCFWPGSLTVADVLLITGMLPSFAIAGLMVGFIRGRGINFAAQAPESLMLPLLIGAGLLLAHGSGPLTLTRCLLALSAAAWATTLVYVAIAVRLTGLTRRRPSLRATLPLIRESAQIFVALVFTGFSARAPLLLAMAVLGPTGAALTEIANRFGTLATVVTNSVAATYSPLFARAVRGDDYGELGKLLRAGALTAGATAALLLAILAAGFPIAARHSLPAIYGHAYPTMILLGTATTINATLGLASNLLFMDGRAARVRTFSMAQLFVIAGAGIPLTMWLGTIGIGIACVLGALIRDGGLFLTVLRLLGARTRGDLAA